MIDVLVAVAVSSMATYMMATGWAEPTPGNLELGLCAEIAERTLTIYEEANPGDTRPRKFVEYKKKKAMGEFSGIAYRWARAQAYKAYIESSEKVGAGLSGAAAMEAATAAYREELGGVCKSAALAAYWYAMPDGTLAMEAEKQWQKKRILSEIFKGE